MPLGVTGMTLRVSKLVALTNEWILLNAATPAFSDVPYGSAFYQYVETAFAHGAVNGYKDWISGQSADDNDKLPTLNDSEEQG